MKDEYLLILAVILVVGVGASSYFFGSPSGQTCGMRGGLGGASVGFTPVMFLSWALLFTALALFVFWLVQQVKEKHHVHRDERRKK